METANENKPNIKKPAKAWIILCIAVNSALLLYTLFTADLLSFSAMNILSVISTAVVVAGLALLLSGRKLGFIVICYCVILNVISNIISGTVTAILIFSAVGNIAITWAIIGWSLKNLLPVNIKKSILSVITLVVLAALGVFTIISGITSNNKYEFRYIYDGPITMQDQNGDTVMEHDDFTSAKAVEKNGSWSVEITLTPEGRMKFQQVTGENIKKSISLRIGNDEIMNALVDSEIDSQVFWVTSVSNKDDAKALAKNINDNIRKY